MAPTNGAKAMASQIMVSVVVAVVLSAGAAFVSVKVMSSDLDRAKDDLTEVSSTARQQSIAIAEMKATQRALAGVNDERWRKVDRRLESIEGDLKVILRDMPRSRRDTGRDR